MGKAERLYRLLLLAYPRELREDVGEDMVEMFRDRLRGERERHGRSGVMRVWARLLLDTLVNALGERLASLGRRPLKKGKTMDSFKRDMRQALKSLSTRPVVTFVALMTLALGIGANTAIFSLIHAVLLRPLPYADPDRLVMVFGQAANGTPQALTYPEFLDVREQQTTLEAVSVWRNQSVNLTGEGEPERLVGSFVSASFLPLLGAEPALGRSFRSEETEVGTTKPVCVISHGLWARRFGRDPAILGRTLNLNGENLTVVGITPSWFDPGAAPAGGWFMATDVWLPVPFYPNQGGLTQADRSMLVVARTKPGVTISGATADLTIVAGRIMAEHADTPFEKGIAARTVHELIVTDARPGLVVLWGAVGLVLLIACANVASLLLARAADREREIALRAALGAGRQALARQLLIESGLLATAGGAGGLLLAYWLVRLVVTGLPEGLLPARVGLEPRVLLFTLLVSIGTGLLFGLVPALKASRPDLNRVLKLGRTTGGFGSGRARSVLVVSEVALSLTLLVGAGLLIKSVVALKRVDLGFQPNRVLTAEFRLPNSKYSDRAKIIAFFRSATERLTAMPGVESAALARAVPMSGNAEGRSYALPGDSPLEPAQAPRLNLNVVTPRYFETMGIPILKGRDFTDADDFGSPSVLIVNRTLANRLWPNKDPLGERLLLLGDETPFTIVGMVGDVKHGRLQDEAQPQAYRPHYQDGRIFSSVVLRTGGDAMALAQPLRKAIWSVDPDQPVWKVRSLESLVEANRGSSRLLTLLLSGFAAVALILAAVGVYGVMSYAVAARTQEIGVRMTLGASKREVMGQVLSRGLRLTALALVLGAGAGLVLSRAMRGVLFGVTPSDPVTFGAAALVLTLVALAACYVPARRAAGVDPLVALSRE